jgi:hypothetical protein
MDENTLGNLGKQLGQNKKFNNYNAYINIIIHVMKLFQNAEHSIMGFIFDIWFLFF